MRRSRLCPLLLLAALLAGCASGPRSVPDDRAEAWRGNRAELLRLDRWRAEGRLVFRTPEGGGQARFTWREVEGDAFSLRLAGPWGQGAAWLDGGDDRAELQAADGRRYVGSDARELLVAVYGWDIPVGPLRRWLIGLPTDGADFELDRFGRVQSLRWRDWSLQYRRYRQRDGIDLPAMLVAARGDDGVELRVAVDSWRLAPGEEPIPESPVPLIGGAAP